MAPDCIHLEKRADLTEQGNVPKLWLGGTQALPPTQLTDGGREMEQGGSERLGTAEYLALEICAGGTNLHFMALSSYSSDYGVGKLGQAEFQGRL